MDADLWVSPSDMDVLRAALREQGWRQYSDFSQGSSFEHAATWVHGWMAAADLHRTYPGVGVDPQVAFDALWEGRQSTVIAGRLCWVPAEAAQRLILLVNAARDGLRDEPDIVAAWDEADEEQRLEVRRWAARLGAEVPLAAAVGELEAFSGRREYRLWRALSSGGAPRLELWWGRVLAEPTLARSVALAVKLALPNPGRERVVRGRRATAVELAGQLVRRVAVGVRELARLRGRARHPGGDPVGAVNAVRDPGRPDAASPARGGAAVVGGGPADAQRFAEGPAQFVVPGEVADVTYETEDGELNAFVVRLPEGKPLWLHDTMALIWSLAADGAPDVVAAVADAVGEEARTVRAPTEAAIAELVRSGLLVAASDG